MPGACVAKPSASRSLDGSASSVCESKTSPTALLPVRSDVGSAVTTTFSLYWPAASVIGTIAFTDVSSRRFCSTSGRKPSRAAVSV